MNEFFTLTDLRMDLAYPFLFLILAALVLLLCVAFCKLSSKFYLSSSLWALLVSFFLSLSNVNAFGLQSRAFFGTLNNDIVAFCAICVILLFSFLYLLMDKQEHRGEFYTLFLFMIASLMLMVSSSNLALIFIGLEASSLALYTLIAMQGSKNAISSALKYFSVAAVGSGFFVLASALIYAQTGSLSIRVFFHYAEESILLSGSKTLILVLCAIKLSLAPFHFWLRDVYYASNSNLAAFISVVPKIAILVVLLRIFSFYPHGAIVICALAIFSMLVAALAALAQKDAKKMLAYSSVVQSSLLVLAMVPIFLHAEYVEKGINSALFLVFGYWVLFAFANYGLFLILSLFEKSDFNSLNNLFAKNPIVAFALATCVLSLAGVAPFGLFWGKFMIFQTLILSKWWYCALVVALTSVLMLGSYLRLIIHGFFVKSEANFTLKLHPRQKFVLIVCVLVNIFALLLML
ncbi:NADH-quinone oxidoreductase subunit N [Campylobacter sp.]|uniref:NADH-quinone oxidoreductase subunit N n=1 Tax=Campylobacter sp. TaxID=205 RepID=UPI0026DC976C|nr:NADH-quinone oxidoreductase subunit N [Campylobacter sp.]MDO4673575.1 NADH-quinone oxidoreductase subunit N [Campylobacter sp.]